MFKGGEEGIAFDLLENVGEVELMAVGQEEGVDLGSARYDERGAIGWGLQFLRRVHDSDPWWVKILVSRENDVSPSREGFSEVFEGVSAHDDGMAEGDFFKKLEIAREVPGELIIASDGTVEGHGSDSDHRRIGTGVWKRVWMHLK